MTTPELAVGAVGSDDMVGLVCTVPQPERVSRNAKARVGSVYVIFIVVL